MTSYFVKVKGRVHGPVPLAGVQRLVKRGVVTPTTELSLDGVHWYRAGEREEIFPAAEAEGYDVLQGGDVSEAEWYYADPQGVAVGPVSTQQIHRLLRSGEVTPETLVWSPELPGWEPLHATPLASLVNGDAHPAPVTVAPEGGHARASGLSAFSRLFLSPDERVLYVAELHPFFFLGPLLVLLTISGSMFFMPLHNSRERIGAFAVVSLLWVGVVAHLLLEYCCGECVVTDRRLIGTTGVIYRFRVVVHLSDISTVYVRQGPLGKLFGYGTVVLRGPGVYGSWWWRGIAFPYRNRIEELANAISSAVLRARTGGGTGR